MKRTAPRFVVHRFVFIGLISLVALAALVTFVVSASRKANRGGDISPASDQAQNTRAAKPLTRLADGKGVNPLAVNITATLADDITLANKKLPGATITYTAVISNATGTTDAAGVVYNDTLDANTTQTGGVTISPLAINDGTYQSIGNMTLTSANLGANCGANALRSVTCNDTLNGATLTGFGNALGTANGTAPGGTVTTTNSGSVVLNADGTFVYNPSVGFEGSDSFFYTLTNSTVTPNLTDVGQVTINVGGSNGMVWFITSAGGGTGRQANPFTLAAFQAVNNGTGTNPADNDTVFLFEGAHTGPVTLRTGQRFIGQDATDTVPNLGGPALPSNGGSTAGNAYPASNPSGTAVSITSAGVGITLGSGNNLAGFTVGNSTTAITGGAVGTLNVREVTINTNGQGLIISTSGTMTNTATFPGFASITTTGGTNGVSLTGVGGTFITTGALSGASGATFNVNGGTLSLTYSGNITQANNAAMVNITGNHTTGTITFQTGTLSATNGTGLQFSNSDGTYNFNGTNTLNGGDAGIDITTGCAGTFSFSSNTAITNPSGIAYNEDTSTANVTYNGTISQSNANNAVNINAKTGGTTAFNRAGGGQITASTTTAGAIDLTNTGGIVNFTGGMSLTTTSGTGFNASGSGATISATQNNTTIVNTISSTTGTALNVASTTIGASGLTFRSITSNGSGTGNGIILDTTGTAGGLTVTGNGGSCTVATPTCSGGTISNKTGADGSTTQGSGIYLNSTSGVSLTLMKLNDFQNNGIRGSSVTGFSLTNSIIIGNNGTTAAGGSEEGAVRFDGLFTTGSFPAAQTAVITNCVLGGTTASDSSFSDDLRVTNSSGTLNRLTITNTNFGKIGSGGNNGMTFSALNNGTVMNGTVTDSFFTNAIGTDADFVFSNNSTMDVVFRRNKLSNNNVNQSSGGGLFVLQGGSGASTVTYDISCNTFQDSIGIALLVAKGNGSGTMVGDIINNTIGLIDATPGTAPLTGSTQASGIKVKATGTGTHTTLIRDNTVHETNEEGIFIQNNDGSATLNASVFHNVVDRPGSFSFAGLNVDVGALAGDTSIVNVVVGSAGTAGDQNDFSAGDPSNFSDVNFSTIGGATIKLSKNGSASLTAANVIKDDNVNPANTNTGVSVVAGSLTLVNTLPTLPPAVAACTLPPIANPDGGDSARTVETKQEVPLNSGSSASPSTFAWLKRLVHPVASFAAKLNFLGQSEAPLAPALITSEKAPVITEVKSDLRQMVDRPATPTAIRANNSSATVAVNKSNESRATDDKPVNPLSGELVTVNVGPLPAGKSITIVYQATVNTPPLAKSVSTQGNVTYTGGPGGGINTDDPETGASNDATVTNIDVLSTWTGATSTDWNTASNWNPSTYAPGVSNPAVNDVVIPNVGNQPNIGTTDIGVFSLNISNGRTLTITSPRILTIGGSPGGNLTLDGIISGGFLNLGTGTHSIINAGVTGSISSTNLTTVLSGSTATLNNNLSMGALAINAGGSMDISNRTLTLTGPGAALSAAGGFTTTGSTVVFASTTGAQTTGTVYNNLTINNAAGVTLLADSTINGVLALTSGDLNTGAFTLTQPNSTASTGTSDVVGNVKRTGSPLAATPLTYGNPNNLITLGANTLTSLNVRLTKTAPTDISTGIANTGFPGAILRTYVITPAGGTFTTATLQLHYNNTPGELNGNTAGTLKLWKYISSPSKGWQEQPASVDNGTTAVTLAGVTGFSPWTMANVSPTASNGTVSGQIFDNNGNPVEGAVVQLTGTQNRKFITDSNGNYRFDNVETNGFYTVTPSRVNYVFSPSQRSFSQLGNSTNAAFSATSATGNALNPLDTPEYFVRQQYLDFLGREPDESGFNFWSDQILACNSDAACVDGKRINVSGAFFLSIEFQQTGYLVYRMYQSAYGNIPNAPVPLRLSEFRPDTAEIGNGVVVLQGDWQARLESNKQAYASEFVQRARFLSLYSGMSDGQFVDTLNHNAGFVLSQSERDQLVSDLSTQAKTRAQVLRSVAENSTLAQQEFNQAFVLMQYFGYLRRDANSGPDTDFSGYNFWLDKLNTFGGNFQNAEMVRAFLVSSEYRGRFPR